MRMAVRFGRAVRYLPADIESFIAASRVDTRNDLKPYPLPEGEEISRP